MKLPGKVALITGAGSGIGAATAHLMADEGASIALVGIPAEGVQEVAAQLASAGRAALALFCRDRDPGKCVAFPFYRNYRPWRVFNCGWGLRRGR